MLQHKFYLEKKKNTLTDFINSIGTEDGKEDFSAI